MVKFVNEQIHYTQAAYAPLLIDQENCRTQTQRWMISVLGPTMQSKRLIRTLSDAEEKQNTHRWKWKNGLLKLPGNFIKLNAYKGSLFYPFNIHEIKLGFDLSKWIDDELIDWRQCLMSHNIKQRCPILRCVWFCKTRPRKKRTLANAKSTSKYILYGEKRT